MHRGVWPAGSDPAKGTATVEPLYFEPGLASITQHLLCLIDPCVSHDSKLEVLVQLNFSFCACHPLCSGYATHVTAMSGVPEHFRIPPWFDEPGCETTCPVIVAPLKHRLTN